MIAVKLHSFSGIKEHNNKDKQWSALQSNNTAWNLAHSKETVKFIISLNDGGSCIQWQNISEVPELLSAKDAKMCLVIGLHFPLLSFSPHQVSENPSYTKHVGTCFRRRSKRHDPPCPNFNCWFQQYMVRQQMSRSNYMFVNWRFMSP